MFDQDFETVALVWSFKDQFKDDPYIVRYVKNKWSCTCPHHTFRKATCKHILSLRSGSKDRSILNDDRFKITDYGRDVLKL